MTDNALNVAVGLTGSVMVAPLGTALPTDSASMWDPAFVDMGFLDDNGIDEGHSDTSTEIIAWQNNLLVRRMITKSELTLKFTMIETKGSTLSLYYKNSTLTKTGSGGSAAYALAIKNPGSQIQAFGFDIIDGDNLQRLVVPTAEVTDRGDISYKSDTEIGYQVTISAYPDSTGTVAYKYSTQASWGES